MTMRIVADCWYHTEMIIVIHVIVIVILLAMLAILISDANTRERKVGAYISL